MNANNIKNTYNIFTFQSTIIIIHNILLLCIIMKYFLLLLAILLFSSNFHSITRQKCGLDPQVSDQRTHFIILLLLF